MLLDKLANEKVIALAELVWAEHTFRVFIVFMFRYPEGMLVLFNKRILWYLTHPFTPF